MFFWDNIPPYSDGILLSKITSSRLTDEYNSLYGADLEGGTLYTVKPVFKTTWEIGTTWELRTTTSAPRPIQYTEMDLRNKTSSEFRTDFHSPLGVSNSYVPLYCPFHMHVHYVTHYSFHLRLLKSHYGEKINSRDWYVHCITASVCIPCVRCVVRLCMTKTPTMHCIRAFHFCPVRLTQNQQASLTKHTEGHRTSYSDLPCPADHPLGIYT